MKRAAHRNWVQSKVVVVVDDTTIWIGLKTFPLCLCGDGGGYLLLFLSTTLRRGKRNEKIKNLRNKKIGSPLSDSVFHEFFSFLSFYFIFDTQRTGEKIKPVKRINNRRDDKAESTAKLAWQFKKKENKDDDLRGRRGKRNEWSKRHERVFWFFRTQVKKLKMLVRRVFGWFFNDRLCCIWLMPR